MPHPPRLVVGRDFEGDLTSATCPLGGAFALYGEFTAIKVGVPNLETDLFTNVNKLCPSCDT